VASRRARSSFAAPIVPSGQTPDDHYQDHQPGHAVDNVIGRCDVHIFVLIMIKQVMRFANVDPQAAPAMNEAMSRS